MEEVKIISADNIIENLYEQADKDVTEKTADDLFKELGYELDKDNPHSKRTIAVYKDERGTSIDIDFNYKEYKNKDYDFIKTDKFGYAEYVSEDEIKAIMKKIEEHKNDKNDWRNKAVMEI